MKKCKVLKHAEAITKPGKGPWYDWLESDEGKQAANVETLSPIKIGSRIYLENRLWRAFTAGMQVGFEQGNSNIVHT